MVLLPFVVYNEVKYKKLEEIISVSLLIWLLNNMILGSRILY